MPSLALWREYRRTGDPALRDRLVLTHAPLAKQVAYRKLREAPGFVDVEDLISAGLEALLHAIERYDPRKGATLEQYAWTRIHGAVLDELRRQDWAPRTVRRWQRDIDRVVEEFAAVHGRPATTREVAAALSIDPAELSRRRGAVDRGSVGSLNVVALEDDGPARERIEMLVDDDEDTDPLRALVAEDARVRLVEAVAELPDREHDVAILLYVQRLTLAEAGRALGVSESRVCQLHARLKHQLRRALSPHEALYATAD
jgi:RNA polymerase sigma factor FliA